jgi:hypothetical protein
MQQDIFLTFSTGFFLVKESLQMFPYPLASEGRKGQSNSKNRAGEIYASIEKKKKKRKILTEGDAEEIRMSVAVVRLLSTLYFLLLFIRYFFIFQMLFPFLVFPEKLLSRVSPPPHPLTNRPTPASCLGIPLHWGIELSQDQGPLLPLMSNKGIFCYICGWIHESIHMYSLVGGLVPGYLLAHVVYPMRLQTPSAPWVLPLIPPLGTP